MPGEDCRATFQEGSDAFGSVLGVQQLKHLRYQFLCRCLLTLALSPAGREQCG